MSLVAVGRTRRGKVMFDVAYDCNGAEPMLFIMLHSVDRKRGFGRLTLVGRIEIEAFLHAIHISAEDMAKSQCWPGGLGATIR